MSTGSLAFDINKIRAGRRSPQADNVAVEEPLEIRLGFGARAKKQGHIIEA